MNANLVTHASSLDMNMEGVVLQFWNGVGYPALKPGCVSVQMAEESRPDPLAIFTCHKDDLDAARRVAAAYKRDNPRSLDRVLVRTLPVPKPQPSRPSAQWLDADEADEHGYMLDAMLGD